MSLYDKLSKEHLEKLDQEMKKYPNLTEGVIKALKGNKFVINLTFGECINLCSALDIQFTSMNVFNIFE